jgi:hypothetical protein
MFTLRTLTSGIGAHGRKIWKISEVTRWRGSLLTSWRSHGLCVTWSVGLGAWKMPFGDHTVVCDVKSWVRCVTGEIIRFSPTLVRPDSTHGTPSIVIVNAKQEISSHLKQETFTFVWTTITFLPNISTNIQDGVTVDSCRGQLGSSNWTRLLVDHDFGLWPIHNKEYGAENRTQLGPKMIRCSVKNVSHYIKSKQSLSLWKHDISKEKLFLLTKKIRKILKHFLHNKRFRKAN